MVRQTSLLYSQLTIHHDEKFAKLNFNHDDLNKFPLSLSDLEKIQDIINFI